MGWGTYIKTEVYCNKVLCENESQVMLEIEKCNEDIESDKATLLSLACCTPKDGYPKLSVDDIEPLDKVVSTFNEIFQDLEDLYSKKERLIIIQEAIQDGEKPVAG